jgi:hypothetical protein
MPRRSLWYNACNPHLRHQKMKTKDLTPSIVSRRTFFGRPDALKALVLMTGLFIRKGDENEFTENFQIQSRGHSI